MNTEKVLNLEDTLFNLDEIEGEVIEAKDRLNRKVHERRELHTELIKSMASQNFSKFAKYLKIDVASLRRDLHGLRRKHK